MNEIELRKAVIFIMWLRQAQPPGRNNFLCPDPKGWKIIMKYWN